MASSIFVIEKSLDTHIKEEIDDGNGRTGTSKMNS
jgi:hypothetical protein